MRTFPMWFKAEDVFVLRGKQIFTGPSPFKLDKNNQLQVANIYHTPLLISHPKARKDCFYKMTGLESYCIRYIRMGQPIGIMVEPINKEKENELFSV